MTPEQKYKLVPVEPTPEMMRSGMNVPFNKAARHNAVYRAMLAAAPTPAEAPADVARDAEPVAYVTGVYGGHTTVAPIDAAQVLRVGMALYTAPPAPSVPDGWKHDCAGILANDVELWVDSCPHCGKPRPAAAPTPAEAPADVARDAARWQMLPAFLEEFQIPYLQLVDKIDTAIDAAMSEKGGA